MQLEVTRLNREPIFRAIARAIELQVLEGTLKPGEALPSETRIAELLGVNRSSVREAIRVLERDGLLGRERGRRRLRVTIPRIVDVSKTVVAVMVLRKVTFENLWEAMYALEPVAAAGAAKRSNDTLIAAIDANLKRTELALDDSSSIAELDIEFHNLIAKAAHNEAIEMAREPFGHIFYPAFFDVISRLNAGPRLLFAHQSIFDAIRDGDEARAFNWMQKHIRDFRRGYSLANLDMNRAVGFFRVHN